MKKLKSILCLAFVLICGTLIFTACGPNNTPPDNPPIDNTCVVTFDTCGGSLIPSVQVEKGSLIEKPSDPTKENYEFIGWYIDSYYNYEFRFAVDTINRDTTLYAKWQENEEEPITYTISFETNGGSVVNSIVVEKDTKINAPQTTKQNYTFIGWYKDNNFVELFDFNTPITEDMTLYAKWQDNSSQQHTHNYITHLGIPSTCTQKGYITYLTCSGCDKLFSTSMVDNQYIEIEEIQYLEYAPHVFGDWYESISPTYLTEGQEKRECNNCEHFETRSIPKLIANITEVSELIIENGILKWNGNSPFGYKLIVNDQTYTTNENELDINLKADDYNSAKVAVIYANGNAGEYVEFNNFIVNAPISNLHFVDTNNQVTFTWTAQSNLYDFIFEINGIKTTIPKTQTQYVVDRNRLKINDRVDIYVTGIESNDFYPSKKVGLHLQQIDMPIMRIEDLNLTWDNIDNASIYKINYKGTNETLTENTYSFDGKNSGDYSVNVTAYAEQDYLCSETSTFNFKKLIMPTITIDNGLISWNAIAGQVRYSILDLNNNNINTLASNSYQLQDFTNEYELLLYAETMREDVMQSDYCIIENSSYKNYHTLYYGTKIKGIKNFIGYDNASIINNKMILVITEKTNYINFNLDIDCLLITNIPLSDEMPLLSNITEIIIPDETTTIVDSAFKNLINLKSVTLPHSVTTIGQSAFSYCEFISKVYIENLESWCNLSSSSYLFSSSYCLYLNGELVEDLIIPDTVTYIKDFVFSRCMSLKNIAIPDSVTTIGDRAFKSCTSLTNIIIPNSVTTIGDRAFESCTSLTNITIPNSVTTIGSYAFESCRALYEINIPSHTTIGVGILRNCPYIKCVKVGNHDILRLFKADSYNIDSDYLHFYYKVEKRNPNYSWLETFYIPNNLKKIIYNDDLIYIDSPRDGLSLTSITEIIIPNSVKTIGDSAFEGCTSIAEIIIPNSVETIGESAFERCTSITEITIPNSVETIGDKAFYNCTSLENINLSNSLTSIGISAFRECKRLRNLTIPDSVNFIGSYAFAETALQYLFIPKSVITAGCEFLPSTYSQKVVVYCEYKQEEIPNTWDPLWNYGYNGIYDKKIKYGYTYEQYLADIENNN